MPIVAVTTNTAPGDREKCLQAGMDDYLAKPVQKAQVLETVRTALAHRGAGANMAGALDRVGGDAALLRELAQLFLDDLPRAMEALRHSIAHRDAGLLRLQAHTLRGSTAFFGAHDAVDLARQLEELGRGENVAGADALLPLLVAALESLETSLRQLISTSVA